MVKTNPKCTIIKYQIFEGKNLNELKQELELDVHRVDISELCKRFETNVNHGLTRSKAEELRKIHGPNALTPPPTTPGAYMT